MDEKSFDEAAREFAEALNQAGRLLGSALQDARRQIELDRDLIERRMSEARAEFRNVMEHGRAAFEAARAEFEREFAQSRWSGGAAWDSRDWEEDVPPTPPKPPTTPKAPKAPGKPSANRKPGPRRRRGGPQAGEPAPVEPKPRPTTLTGGAEAPIE